MSGAVKKILVVLDHNGNEIRNFLVHVLAADPASPTVGQMWFNSTEGKLKYRNASGIQSIASGGETHDHGNKAVLDQLAQADLDKLDGIATGATRVEDSSINGNVKINGTENVVYSHPANHAATVITQDSTHRFVTDVEKTTWNGMIPATEKGAASGVATLDSGGLIPVSQIPAGYKECLVYLTYAAMQAETGMISGNQAFVVDASGDPTVESGSAEYIYHDSSWIKIAEVESMDAILEWANIVGKPSTFTPSTHGNEKHSESYINSTGVTYETLNANGDVGTGSAQVAKGDHAHPGVYDPAGTAASAVSTHSSDTTSVHGIVNTADLALKSGVISQFSDVDFSGAIVDTGQIPMLTALGKLGWSGYTVNDFALLGLGLSQFAGITSTDAAIEDAVTKRHSHIGRNTGHYATTLSTSATSYTLTHGLGTKDVLVQVYAVATGEQVEVGIERYSTTQIKMYFATAPAANAYRVVVMG